MERSPGVARRAIIAVVPLVALLFSISGCGPKHASPQTAEAPIPAIAQKDGRYALMVDGAPFLMMGVQANNSSNYPAVLPHVWPAVEDIAANTLIMPVAWEQIEPKEGAFDFSFPDTLLKEARAHHKRLVLLWFGAYKNTSPSYAPQWVQTNRARFPHLIDAAGKESYVFSPLGAATLEADKKAFAALMAHLKATDSQRTVIMVQVENETGTYRSVRDHSPAAEKLFEGAVPADLVKGLKKQPGTWKAVFGKDADEFFHAWCFARYVEAVAKAGKAVYPLPMYVNAALRASDKDQDPFTYASGGPTWNVLDIWHLVAPSIFTAAPDLYSHPYADTTGSIRRYTRPDNPLLIVEIGSSEDFARFFYAALGNGTLGFAPFGIDYTGYSNFPLGAKTVNAQTAAPFARGFKLVTPMMREWAKLAYEGHVSGVAEPDDHAAQTIALGKWQAKVEYQFWEFGGSDWTWMRKQAGIPEGTENPRGGAAIAQMGPGEFLVIGYHSRVTFSQADSVSQSKIYSHVEEGHFEKGKWKFERVWNGDQSDYGLNFAQPRTLKVKLATY